MKITLDGLRVLDAIDRRGSFAAAADELFRVPSALSYSVQKLEADLGVSLFEKQGKKSVLTEAGRVLLDDGRRLLLAADQVERRTRRIATGWESELRLGLETLLPLSALLPLISGFDQLECGTRLQINAEVLGGSWDALTTGRSDLAIGASGDMPSGGGYQVRELVSVEMVFAVSPDHPLARCKSPVSERMLSDYRAVVITDSSRQLVPRTANVLDAQERLLVPDLSAKLACQVAGLGVGSLPAALAEAEQAQGRLVILPMEVPPAAARLKLAWRSDNHGKALQWFVEALTTRDIDWTVYTGY